MQNITSKFLLNHIPFNIIKMSFCCCIPTTKFGPKPQIVFPDVFQFSPLSVPSPQCSILIFIYTLFLSGGKWCEVWTTSNKAIPNAVGLWIFQRWTALLSMTTYLNKYVVIDNSTFHRWKTHKPSALHGSRWKPQITFKAIPVPRKQHYFMLQRHKHGFVVCVDYSLILMHGLGNPRCHSTY